jgi:hypothetical protein
MSNRYTHYRIYFDTLEAYHAGYCSGEECEIDTNYKSEFIDVPIEPEKISDYNQNIEGEIEVTDTFRNLYEYSNCGTHYPSNIDGSGYCDLPNDIDKRYREDILPCNQKHYFISEIKLIKKECEYSELNPEELRNLFIDLDKTIVSYLANDKKENNENKISTSIDNCIEELNKKLYTLRDSHPRQVYPRRIHPSGFLNSLNINDVINLYINNDTILFSMAYVNNFCLRGFYKKDKKFLLVGTSNKHLFIKSNDYEYKTSNKNIDNIERYESPLEILEKIKIISAKS